MKHQKIFLPFLFLFHAGVSFANDHSLAAFTENKGQLVTQDFSPNTNARYVFQDKNFKVVLNQDGFSYELWKHEILPATGQKPFCKESKQENPRSIFHRLDFTFVGINKECEIIPGNALPGTLNFYTPGSNGGITEVKQYSKIIYREIYKGIDAEFLVVGENNFKYNFIVHPGADLFQLKLRCEGTHNLSLQNGKIVIKTSFGILEEEIPFSFSETAPVKVDYKLDGNIISFSSSYDKSKTLTIDPFPSLQWSTYYGDAGSDFVYGILTDASDNVIVSGFTNSTLNIATAGSYQDTMLGVYDIFLAKFNSSGVRQWATYFGSTNLDRASGAVIDNSGNIYVAGSTFSTSGIATAGAHQTTYGGGIDDALLAKFSPSGTLTWATYYGGTDHDYAQAVCIDNSGYVIITGHTESPNNMATPSGWQTTFTGSYDAYVAKFDGNGVRQWGTYYGDFGYDEGYAIAADNSGNIYVTGFTQGGASLTTFGCHQPLFGGGSVDGFLAKFNPSGTNLDWATYYGGTATDEGDAVACDNAGNIYLAGYTTSTNAISTPSSFQPSITSTDDSYLVKFNSSGARVWGTYFGGNNVEYVFALKNDGSDLYFGGMTQSSNSIATPGAFHENIIGSGIYDAYLEKFDTSGARTWGTYFGGSSNEELHAIALDSRKNLLLSGFTTSADSIATTGAHQTAWGGGYDAFVMKFCQPPVPVITASGPLSYCEGDSVILTAPGGYISYLWSDATTGTSTYLPSTATAGIYPYYVSVVDSNSCPGVSDTVNVVVNICNSISEQSVFEMNVFPNPVRDELNILISGEVEMRLEIFSSSGKLVYSSEEKIAGNKLKKINVSHFAAGVYEIAVTSGSKIARGKVIIQK